MRNSPSNFDIFLYYLNSIIGFIWKHVSRCWRNFCELISPPSTADEYRHFTDFQNRREEEFEIGSSSASKGTYSPPMFVPISQSSDYDEKEEELQNSSKLEESELFGKGSVYYSTIETSTSNLDKTIYYDPDSGTSLTNSR